MNARACAPDGTMRASLARLRGQRTLRERRREVHAEGAQRVSGADDPVVRAVDTEQQVAPALRTRPCNPTTDGVRREST